MRYFKLIVFKAPVSRTVSQISTTSQMIFDDETHDIYGLIVSAPELPAPGAGYINQIHEDGPANDENERLYGKYHLRNPKIVYLFGTFFSLSKKF